MMNRASQTAKTLPKKSYTADGQIHTTDVKRQYLGQLNFLKNMYNNHKIEWWMYSWILQHRNWY